MRYKKAAFAFSMLYAVCLLGIAGYWNKTKPVDAAVEVSEKPKIAITFDDDVIIGLSQEISYKEAVSMI